jgi:hypothetical protein
LLGVWAVGGPAAVDREDGAADEAGLIRQQVADRVGCLRRPPGPAERVQGTHLVVRAGRGGAAAGQQLIEPAGGDRAERDGVDPDTTGPVVDGERTGEALDRGLSRRVRQGAAHGPLRLMGGHVDDRAAGPRRDEPADRGGAAGDRQGEVGRDQPGHLAGRDLVQPDVPEHGGVVHPPGQPACLLRQVGGLSGDGLVRGVPGDRHHPPFGLVGPGPAKHRRIAVKHHDGVPVGQQPFGHGPADSPAASGHYVRTDHARHPTRPRSCHPLPGSPGR